MSIDQPPTGHNIPLLTAVLAPAPAELNANDEVAAADTNSQWPAPAAPALGHEAQWRQLAQDIQEQVLQQLLGQVNSLLEQQVAQQMAIAFEHVTQQLTAQIQVNLEQALQQSVRLAVEQEIKKTRMTQNKGF